MNIKPSYIVIVISILVVVMVAIALTAMVMRSIQTGSPIPAGEKTPAGENQPISNAPQTAPSTNNTPPSTHTSVQPSGNNTVASSKISILSPAVSDKWVIGQNNVIRWSKEAQIPGSIYLVNAVTDKAVPVGWILSETDPHQTSYTWNTRDVFLSRTNPAKKNLETGDYIIKIKFDSKAIPEVSSAPFSIIYQSEVQIPTYDIQIKDFEFDPATLTVKKGDKIRFTNNDTVEHRIVLSSVSPFVVAPGQSFTFDTSVFRSGSSYTFYSEAYSTLTLKVVVQ